MHIEHKYILTQDELQNIIYLSLRRFWPAVCPECERDINIVDYVCDEDIKKFIEVISVGE